MKRISTTFLLPLCSMSIEISIYMFSPLLVRWRRQPTWRTALLSPCDMKTGTHTQVPLTHDYTHWGFVKKRLFDVIYGMRLPFICRKSCNFAAKSRILTIRR